MSIEESSESTLPDETVLSGKDVIFGAMAGLGSFGLFTLTLAIVVVVISTQTDNRLDPATSLGFLVVGAFAQSACFMVGGWFPVWRRKSLSLAALGFRAMSWKWFGAAVLATIIMFFLQAAFSMLNPYVDVGGREMEMMIVGTDPDALRFGMLFFAIAIAAPISEEVFFRGLLFGWASRRWGFLLPAIATSLFFGVLHQQYSVIGLILVGIIGFVSAGLYYISGSIWTAISYHAMNNAIFMVVLFWLPDLA